jgi:hypothetical protein
MHVVLLLSIVLHGVKVFCEEEERISPRDMEDTIQTVFVADITSKYFAEETHYSMFRALTIDPKSKVLREKGENNTMIVDYNSIRYLSVERLGTNNHRGLFFTSGVYSDFNGSEASRSYGFDLAAEDPRIVTVGNNFIVAFTVNTGRTSNEHWMYYQRWMAVSYFDKFDPIILKIPGIEGGQSFVEKNWMPFSKNNTLHFIYSIDPLVILRCDPADTECSIVHIDKGVSLPLNTENTFLRGGSNLVPVSDSDDRYFIGGCHTYFTWKYRYYMYVAILLDTVEWKIIHVTKPLRFVYNDQPVGWGSHITLGRVGNTLTDMFIDHNGLGKVSQFPISIMKVDHNTFHTTISVRECVTLLYRLHIPTLQDIIREFADLPRRAVGHWQARTKDMTDYFGDAFTNEMARGHTMVGVRRTHTADGRPVPAERLNFC